MRVIGPRGEVTVDLADVIPILWRATGVALWQLEVAKGAGPNGTDLATAWLGGALEQEAVELQKRLVGYGVRCRLLPFAEFARRLGVGRERPEVRVRVREAPPSPPRPPEITSARPAPPPVVTAPPRPPEVPSAQPAGDEAPAEPEAETPAGSDQPEETSEAEAVVEPQETPGEEAVAEPPDAGDEVAPKKTRRKRSADQA
jgi:hypothetical protein